MSVIVATAYMDEAERFDWLAAMNDGKVIAHGAPKEIIGRRPARPTLDDAFIALLPEEKRGAASGGRRCRRGAEGDDIRRRSRREGLTRRFGDFVAVDHVSFRIGRGEIFGFLGSNGCGKTTTMKMLTGLLPVTEGLGQTVREADGRRRHGGAPERRLHVAGVLALQRAHRAPEPRAARAPLTTFLRTSRRPNRRTAGTIRPEAVADAKPESLPLGVKQRLQLAVAVIHRPAMLILDEPTSGVDPVARDQFWRTLIDLSRDDGVTIFLSTHFMNEAERCDRISLMHQGRVLAVGAPTELVKERGSATLEDAFISCLEEAAGQPKESKPVKPRRAGRGARVAAGRARPNRARPGGSIPDGYGPIRGGKPWSSCAILFRLAFASSVPSF